MSVDQHLYLCPAMQRLLSCPVLRHSELKRGLFCLLSPIILKLTPEHAPCLQLGNVFVNYSNTQEVNVQDFLFHLPSPFFPSFVRSSIAGELCIHSAPQTATAIYFQLCNGNEERVASLL